MSTKLDSYFNASESTTRRASGLGAPSCCVRLQRAIDQYLVHYHRERNHQGLGNQIIDPAQATEVGEIICRERLGGLLKFYSRAA